MLTTLTLTAPAMQAGMITTFGHIFKQGDIPAGQILQVTQNGTSLPVQMDVKATWPDGSVKHAVLSLENPLSTMGEAVLDLGTAPLSSLSAPAPALDLVSMIEAQDYDFTVNINGETVDALSLLQQQNGGNLWLAGSLATEARVTHTMENGVELRLDIRALVDGTIETSVIVGNDNIQTVRNENITYNIEIRQNGDPLFVDDALTQYHHTVWREKFSTGPENKTVAQYDHDYLRNTGLMPNIDEDTPILQTQSAYDHYRQNPDDYTPMKTGALDTIRGDGGATGDYGLVSHIQHQYLVTQSYEARTGLLENTDQMGVFSRYYRNPETDSAYFIEDTDFNSYYTAAGKDIDGTNGVIQLQNDATRYGASITSHKPSEYYIPYMITGDRYYADGLESEAALLSLWSNGSYLAEDAHFNYGGQAREQAWHLRDVFYGASLLPDGSHAAEVMQNRLEAILDGYVQIYLEGNATFQNDLGREYSYPAVKFAGGDLEGVINGNNHVEAFSRPYMYDWLGSVIGEMAQAGHEQAVLLAEWMANFSAGRFLQDDFNPYLNGEYTLLQSGSLQLDDTTSWAELNDLAMAGLTSRGRTLENTENLWSGLENRFYISSTFGSLASLFSGTQDVRYAEALLWMTQAIGEDYLNTQFSGSGDTAQFGIPVSFTDGSKAGIFDRLLGDAEANTLDDGSGNALVHAGAGNDVILTGSGHHLVAAGDGDDQILAGDGEDWLFGGSGADMISGGAGVNYLQGDRYDADFGRFADQFVFDGALGMTTIGDFTVGQDQLIFLEFGDFTGVSDILSSFETRNGNAVLDLGAGQVLTLTGVITESLTETDIGTAVHSFEALQPEPIELKLSGGDDVYEETHQADMTIKGLNGDDRITTGEGDDTLYGGKGHDQLRSGAGDDILRGSQGNDVLWGGDGSDSLYGGGQNDHLYGEEGHDLLMGRSGNDWLSGEAGDDMLDGGLGIDTAWFSGQVSDYELIQLEDGRYQMTGLDGVDVLWNVEQVQFGSSEVVSLESLMNPVELPQETADMGSLIDQAVNVVEIDLGNSLTFGTAAHDRIENLKSQVIGKQNIMILGEDGNDYLINDHWNVDLRGGAGNDVLVLNGSQDRGTGGEGADFFVFDQGRTNSIIMDFEHGVDTLVFLNETAGVDAFADLTMYQDGSDVVIDLFGADDLRLRDVMLSDLDTGDFLFG